MLCGVILIGEVDVGIMKRTPPSMVLPSLFPRLQYHQHQNEFIMHTYTTPENLAGQFVSI